MRRSLLAIVLGTLAAATLSPAQVPSFSQMLKGEDLWTFISKEGGRYEGSKDPKDWHGMPGIVVGFSYSGKGPLPAPKELIIPLKKRLPLGPPYRLFVKNFYRGKMEATVGDVTKPLEIRRFDWTPGEVFEPNQIEGFDKIVLRYFPSAIGADTGVAQTQNYIVQGVFLTTELKKVPIKGGEILETIAQEPPKAKAGNYLQNAGFEVGLFPWGKPFGVSGAYGPENLDSTTAAEGLTSFKRVLGRATGGRAKHGGEEALLETRNYLLPPGSYALSYYAKADKSIKLTARLAGVTEDLKTVANTALALSSTLTAEWKQYTVKAEVEGLPGFLYALRFSVESEGPATVWLDAVQLQNGEATKFQPGGLTEVGYTCTAPGNIFYAGESSSVDLLVHNTTGAALVTVDYRVIDYWGHEVENARKQVPLAQGRGRLAVALPARKTGLFRVLWSAGASASEMVYSVVPANPHLTGQYPEGTLGVDTVFEEKQLSILKRANFNWINTKSLARWSNVEQERGRFDFNDQALAAAERAHLMVLFQPHNLAWSVKGQPWLEPLFRPRQNTGEVWQKKAEYLSAWGEYIYALVSHCKGAVKYWEIENEPNAVYPAAEYAELLQVAIEQARRADPEAKIVGFAGGGFHREYYENALQTVDPKGIDVFSLHVYGNGPSDFAPFAALLGKYGKRGWNTETGATCPTFFTTLPEHEALRTKNYWEALQRSVRATTISTAQNYLRSMSEGHMEKYFYYFARFVNCGPSQPTSRYGGGKELVEFDGALRANAVALCIASHFIDGARYEGPVEVDLRLQIHLFHQGQGSVGYIWARPDHPMSVAPPEGLTLHDIMGNELNDKPLRVTESPVYFASPKDVKNSAAALFLMKIEAASREAP